MEIRDARVLILGGSGLVGTAIARELLRHEPARLTITALTRREAEEGIDELRSFAHGSTELDCSWGNLLASDRFKDRDRNSLLESPESRGELLDDLYGQLDRDRLESSYLYRLIHEERPAIVVDCVNTATAIAYQDLFTSVKRLRAALDEGTGGAEAMERHLASVYLPQLIRHARILLEALRTADTDFYLKVGTSGTGGMGLNVPFTHSEDRPSDMLLAKASVAGAHSLLLFLMARTPGAPAVKEIKPTAAIAWKRIAKGPIMTRGEPMPLYDAAKPVGLSEALDAGDAAWSQLDGHLDSVYIDAGENGQFSRDEFETISGLGMMELVTPEEIAMTVIREIRGHPTGLDVVAALDGAAMGPTYRGGVLREMALRRMEELEARHGCRSVAFERLGPPRLTKLLYEAHELERLYETLERAAELEPDETGDRAQRLIEDDDDLRVSILSVGLPILRSDGRTVLRGRELKTRPENGSDVDERLLARGWVDLRPRNWSRWRERIRGFIGDVRDAPDADEGSIADIDQGGRSERIRPGALAAWIMKVEDGGERVKR